MANDQLPKVRQEQWNETPASLQAFEDFVELAAKRGKPSVKLLFDRYTMQHKGPDQPDPPTTSYDTLRQWSSRFNWPERRKERARKHNEAVYAEMQSSLTSEKAEAIQAVKRAMGQAKPGELASLVRLLFELLDAPLPKQVQVTGAGGGPLVQVDVLFPHLSTAELAAMAQRAEQLPVIEMQQALPEAGDGDGNGEDDGSTQSG